MISTNISLKKKKVKWEKKVKIYISRGLFGYWVELCGNDYVGFGYAAISYV